MFLSFCGEEGVGGGLVLHSGAKAANAWSVTRVPRQEAQQPASVLPRCSSGTKKRVHFKQATHWCTDVRSFGHDRAH